MKFVRTLAVLGTSLAIGACVPVPPGPAVMVMPGKDKDEPAFQQDESVCQQHAIAHTGYGDPSRHPAPSTPGAPMPLATGAGTNDAATLASILPPDEVGYMQCMAARGDIVQMAAMAGYDAGYAYGYPYNAVYPYPYGYGYPDGYPFAYPYYAGFIGGFGGIRYGGFHHGGWGHGGWGHAGFHGGGHAGHGGGGGHGAGGGHH